MKLHGTVDELMAALGGERETAILKRSRRLHHSRAVAEYQAAALIRLASPFDRSDARILEIGTARGYSASILAQAAPRAQIVTLNPDDTEVEAARVNLSEYGNIEVVQAASWDYLETSAPESFDLIFVDGDHKQVTRDIAFWDRLKPNGLMLFHDYSPAGTYRACPPVFEAVNRLGVALGRVPDVLIADDGNVGMAGFVRRGAEMPDWGLMRDAFPKALLCSMQTETQLIDLFHMATTCRDVRGDVVECGATRGGTAAVLSLALGKRKTWLYDSFEGNPMPRPEDGGRAMQRYALHREGWCKGDEKDARFLFKQIGVRVTIKTGWFEDTFTQGAPAAIAVLHVDADLYAGTRQALERWYPLVTPGGLVIVGAYHHWQGVRRALDEFEAAAGVALQRLGHAAWWRKEDV